MLTALLLATCAANLSGSQVSDAPLRSARLFAQATPPIPTPTVDRFALAAERQSLIAARPGLGFPIMMISIGAPLSALFIAGLASVASSYGGLGVDGAILLSVLIAAAVAMVVIGIVTLVNRIP